MKLENGKSVYRLYLEGQNDQKLFVDGLPREAIEFVNKGYESDHHIGSAFHHAKHIPDDIFPANWMDFKLILL